MFGAGLRAAYAGGTKSAGARKLTHVVQQGDAPRMQSERPTPRSGTRAGSGISGMIQRAGDPAAIPKDFLCPVDLAPGQPTGTDIVFAINQRARTRAHKDQLAAFKAAWVESGGTSEILVHGYASTLGDDQSYNWILSCDRARAVQDELIKLGIPPVNISIVAHGESTDFGSGAAANSMPWSARVGRYHAPHREES